MAARSQSYGLESWLPRLDTWHIKTCESDSKVPKKCEIKSTQNILLGVCGNFSRNAVLFGVYRALKAALLSAVYWPSKCPLAGVCTICIVCKMRVVLL